MQAFCCLSEALARSPQFTSLKVRRADKQREHLQHYFVCVCLCVCLSVSVCVLCPLREQFQPKVCPHLKRFIVLSSFEF